MLSMMSVWVKHWDWETVIDKITKNESKKTNSNYN